MDEEDTIVPQKVEAEFLRWHHRLGHASPKKIQALARMRILPGRLASCQVPICTGCMYGKATRRPWRTKSPNNGVGTARTITRPGDCVSIDQLESATPGLIAQLKGKPTVKRYRVATVFVDHYSRVSYAHLQVSTSAEETVLAKEAFERFASGHGVQIRHYHADNGRFAENLFREAVRIKSQTLSFCGVNAHFQNGVAERRIRELQEHARTMLVHAQRRWPQAITAHLWPYALRMANDYHNLLPGCTTDTSPMELLSGTRVSINPSHYHHFGCPIYVLDNDLQAGKKIDKWAERVRVGIYLGSSPQHARSVALVLSLSTGLTSPQFHFKTDSAFRTMRASFGDGINGPKSLWQEKCHFLTKNLSASGASGGVHGGPGLGVPVSPSTAPGAGLQRELQQLTAEPLRGTLHPPQNTTAPPTQETPPTAPPATTEPASSAATGSASLPTTRSGRSIRIPERFLQAMEALSEGDFIDVCHEAIKDAFADNDTQPCVAYPASADPDTMYHHEAMRQPDADKFLFAMDKEMNDHLEAGTIKLVRRSAIPRGVPIIPSVWQMRRKRRISTGEIYRWKARMNFDGSKQVQGVNYWETYAPVASWPTIRMILMLTIMLAWKSRQIDYVLAFPQADAETDNLFMKVPRGFHVEGENTDDYAFQLLKNLYGQKQAGRVWFKYLVERLKRAGFTQSSVEECLFYKGRVIYVLYTDDSIICAPTDAELDGVIRDIEATGLKITVEGNVADFLGVNIDRRDDGSIKLSQPRLIEQILKDLRLDGDNVATKDTPASPTNILRKYPESESFDQHFAYRSVIGKLGYVERGSRPDIAYAVHQCARFAADPKKEHGNAVKWIGRYLKATRDDGMIFRPREHSFDCHVDADFSGNWHRDEAENDPSTAKSRTGFIISYASCPIIWSSRMQTTIALSTTEAEYIALSTALRDVLPLMRLVKEMKDRGFELAVDAPKVHCKVFEDNSGAIELAKVPKMRPRTKHINVVYHHFRHHVENGDVSVLPISTDDQNADLLTKPLPVKLVKRHRMSICGW